MNKAVASKLLNATRCVMDELNAMTGESRVSEWSEADLWKELVACILGSVVPFETAQAFAKHLASIGVLGEAQRGTDLALLEKRLSDGLARPLRQPTESDLSLRYRFPNLRARHISRTAKAIYGTGCTLRAILDSSPNEMVSRNRIVEIAYGVGPKQASLFLRNTGYAKRLAILDVHVLRFMCVIGLADTPISSIQSISVYERFERNFQEFADTEGASVGLMDIAVWVVMRVYQREGARWHL